MVSTPYSYPATLKPDEDGRLVVRFPTFPEALTDGANEAEALREAADCLSEALASRIVDGEEIPAPMPMEPGQYLISPDPTVALKAALYMALRQRDMTVADLAERLAVDWHQAARLIDPKRASRLTSLAAALATLGCHIAISIEDSQAPAQYQGTWRMLETKRLLWGVKVGVRAGSLFERLGEVGVRDDALFERLEKALAIFREIAEKPSAPDNNTRIEATAVAVTVSSAVSTFAETMEGIERARLGQVRENTSTN